MLSSTAAVLVSDCLSHVDVFALRATCKSLSILPVINLHLAGKLSCTQQLQIASKTRIAASALRLSLEFCNKLTDASLSVLKSFVALTSLNLNGCPLLTDTGARRAIADCPKLRELNLYWNPALTNVTAAALTESDVAAQLVRLNLSGVKHLSDNAVARLAAACPRLTHLDLTRVEALGDGALEAIGKHCPRLRTLLLYACSKPGEKGVTAIARGCPRLQQLDLCGGHFVTDGAMAAVASGCPDLRSLNLTWCIQLTDKSCHALAALKQLRFLSIHGQRKVTDDGFNALAKGCVRLEVLDVNGTSVSWEARAAAQQLFPSLKLLVTL